MVPTLQLTKPTIIVQGAIGESIFKKKFPVSLPFPITLYNTSNNTIYLWGTGVSVCP
jgi:hypothetical protein